MAAPGARALVCVPPAQSFRAHLGVLKGQNYLLPTWDPHVDPPFRFRGDPPTRVCAPAGLPRPSQRLSHMLPSVITNRLMPPWLP